MRINQNLHVDRIDFGVLRLENKSIGHRGHGVKFARQIREGIAVRAATHVDAAVKLEVTLVAPAGAPGVFNGPVVKSRTRIGAISDGKNSVIHILGRVFAMVRSVDSTGVISEIVDDHVGQGHRAARSQEKRHRILIPLRDVDRTSRDDHSGLKGNVERTLSVGDAAGMIVLTDVGVGKFGVKALGAFVLEVLKGVRGESSVATVVVKILGALNQLLLRQQRCTLLLVQNRHMRLEAADRAESPARSAFLLVLDSSDHALLAPIDALGDVETVIERGGDATSGCAAILRVHQNALREFLVSKITELVDSHSPTFALSVMSVNLIMDLMIDGLSKRLFLRGIVRFLENLSEFTEIACVAGLEKSFHVVVVDCDREAKAGDKERGLHCCDSK